MLSRTTSGWGARATPRSSKPRRASRRSRCARRAPVDVRALHRRSARYRWGRTYEGLRRGSRGREQLGAAAIRGLQQDLELAEAVLACAKHYVGDGGTTYGRTRGRAAPCCSIKATRASTRRRCAGCTCGHTLRRQRSRGLDHGVLQQLERPKGLRPCALVDRVLKQELGFEGFLVSDYYAIGQIDADYNPAVMRPSTPVSTWPWSPQATRRSSTHCALSS